MPARQLEKDVAALPRPGPTGNYGYPRVLPRQCGVRAATSGFVAGDASLSVAELTADGGRR
jgi:hypothetical protein